MGHDESKLREAERDGVQIDRIGELHVERRRQAQLFANADAQHAAVHEGDGARARGQQIEQRGHAIVLDRIAMHGGKEAERLDMPARERRFHLRSAAGAVGFTIMYP